MCYFIQGKVLGVVLSRVRCYLLCCLGGGGLCTVLSRVMFHVIYSKVFCVFCVERGDMVLCYLTWIQLLDM